MQKEKIDLILMEKIAEKGGELKSSEIRTILKNVQAKRKIENKRNMKTYFSMIEYLTQRTENVDQILPQQLEISILEVFKKLTESGWLVKLAEFRQILEFVGVDFINNAVQKNDKVLKNFVQRFCEEIGISNDDIVFIIGREDKRQ